MKTPPSPRFIVSFAAATACVYFWMAGQALIPHLGIEHDETLFVEAIYPPREDYSIPIGTFHLPIMLMTYVGALKAWIYRPIFGLFGTSLSTLRQPVLLAGAASIWLFFLLLRRVSGNRAALIGCWLLAVDSTYLLTLCFDWGPVALQHLLTIGGVYLLVRFAQDGSAIAAAGGSFLLGLALWDKAISIWMLSGLVVAAVVVYRGGVFRLIRVRILILAIPSFMLGALPLIYYNAANSFVTFRENVHSETPEAMDLSGKVRALKNAAGAGLFGWLTSEDDQTPQPHQPKGLIESTSVKISAWAGHPRQNLLLYAFILALLVAPFAGRGSLTLVAFCLIVLMVAWIEMAFTAHAGSSIHHIILLWPLPEAVVAISFAGYSFRTGRAGARAIGGALSVMVIWGCLVMNEYYAVMTRNGGTPGWNDAVLTLSTYLKSIPSKHVLSLDWGIIDPLRFLNAGTLPVQTGDEEVSRAELRAGDHAAIQVMISEPMNVFVCHTAAFAAFPERCQRLLQVAATSGYERELLAVIPDTFGRSVFEVFRLRSRESQGQPH